MKTLEGNGLGIALVLLLSPAGCAALNDALSTVPGGTSVAAAAAEEANREANRCDLSVPLLRGLTRDQARERLSASNITGEVGWQIVECSDGTEPGRVCSSSPAEGQLVCARSPLTAYVQDLRHAPSAQLPPAAASTGEPPAGPPPAAKKTDDKKSRDKKKDPPKPADFF